MPEVTQEQYAAFIAQQNANLAKIARIVALVLGGMQPKYSQDTNRFSIEVDKVVDGGKVVNNDGTVQKDVLEYTVDDLKTMQKIAASTLTKATADLRAARKMFDDIEGIKPAHEGAVLANQATDDEIAAAEALVNKI